MGVSPAVTLDSQDLAGCGCEEAGATFRVLSGSAQMEIYHFWCLCQQACSAKQLSIDWVRGLVPFRTLGCADESVCVPYGVHVS